MSDAAQILAAGRLIARRRAPYFRSILLSFESRPAPGLGTVGCTKRGILMYDPEFVAKLTPDQMGGLWIHECMHRLQKHQERCGARDQKTFNMAGDLTINPMVLDMGLQLPDGDNAGLYPDKYGWERGLTADEYYDKLRQLPPDEKDAPEQPGAGAGWCGSCAGNPLPNEPPDGEGRGDAELERINRQTAEAIREHASQKRGTMPAELGRWADDILKPPKIPWSTKLARAIRASCGWRDGAVQHRYDGPGRRQAGIGYGPGKPVMPRLRAPTPAVAVVIDTSGSMGQKELTIALREANGALRAIGADIDFVSCDARVHGLGRIKRIEQAAALCKGGGGTDFRPAFEALERRKPKPEVVIFATDGFGPAPELPPRGMKTIWLLIGEGAQRPCNWGEAIVVDDDGAK